MPFSSEYYPREARWSKLFPAALPERSVRVARGPAEPRPDVEAIKLGGDFVKVLAEEVAKIDVFLAVIGPKWLDARDDTADPSTDRCYLKSTASWIPFQAFESEKATTSNRAPIAMHTSVLWEIPTRLLSECYPPLVHEHSQWPQGAALQA